MRVRYLTLNIPHITTMPAIVGEVLERRAGGKASNAAPTPPSQSHAGFPKVQHRSHVSAFKRVRAQAARPGAMGAEQDAPAVQDSAAAPAGPSRMAARPAVPPAPRSAPSPSEGLSADGILQQVQAENNERVSRMSESERQEELGELEAMFGRDLLERLRQRGEKQDSAADPGDCKDLSTPAAGSQSSVPAKDERPTETARDASPSEAKKGEGV